MLKLLIVGMVLGTLIAGIARKGSRRVAGLELALGCAVLLGLTRYLETLA